MRTWSAPHTHIHTHTHRHTHIHTCTHYAHSHMQTHSHTYTACTHTHCTHARTPQGQLANSLSHIRTHAHTDTRTSSSQHVNICKQNWPLLIRAKPAVKLLPSRPRSACSATVISCCTCQKQPAPTYTSTSSAAGSRTAAVAGGACTHECISLRVRAGRADESRAPTQEHLAQEDVASEDCRRAQHRSARRLQRRRHVQLRDSGGACSTNTA